METVKQPSVTVKPSSQESLRVGSTVVKIGVILGSSNVPCDMYRLRPERKAKTNREH